MNKQDFLRLLDNAQIDSNGNLYYIRDSEIKNKVYFAVVTTICDDFVDEYCYKEKNRYEYYNRHFTLNDDTIQMEIVSGEGKNEN